MVMFFDVNCCLVLMRQCDSGGARPVTVNLGLMGPLRPKVAQRPSERSLGRILGPKPEPAV
jgi:hypothetical protein